MIYSTRGYINLVELLLIALKDEAGRDDFISLYE